MKVDDTFQQLIKALKEKFEKDERVHALWLEGSYGSGQYDEFSDIDVWLDVDDESWLEIWQDIEAVLSKFGKWQLLVEKPIQHDHVDRSYSIEGLPITAHIDISIEKHSRRWWLTTGDADPDIKVVFDKSHIIKWRRANNDEQIKERDKQARQAYGFFQAYAKPGVIRNVNRKNYLEAVEYYLLSLDWLLILMRLKYQPTKVDFRLKHITKDIPEEEQTILTGLYTFSKLDDIERNIKAVDELVEQYANSRS